MRNTLNQGVSIFVSILFAIGLTSCSSTEGDIKKACNLASRGSEALKAKDPDYTDYYKQSADILQTLAEKDDQYKEAYLGAVKWASGSGFSYDDLKEDFSKVMALQELCSKYSSSKE
jgi:hypothetical protein